MNTIATTTTQEQYSTSFKTPKRQSKNKPITVARRRKYDQNEIFGETQKQPQHHSREASSYAKAMQSYISETPHPTINPHNVVLANWFNGIEILELDLGNWRGQPGKVLRVKTLDNVLVTQVDIAIRDNNGALLELGYADPVDNSWWEYTTYASGSGNLTVYATAQDLPGNTTEISNSI